MLSKRWYDGLPADLQEQIMTAAKQAAREVLPWSLEFLDQSRASWKANGGEMVTLPEAEAKELREKIATVGEEIVKDKPGMKPMWDMLTALAKKH